MILRSALLVGLALIAGSAFSATCPESAAVELSLLVAPGEFAGARGALTLSVHAEGCVAFELPDFRVDRGQYRLQLKPSEYAQLRRDAEQMAEMNQIELDQSIAAAAQRGRAAGELFAVHDADVTTLLVYGTSTPRALRISGLKQLAAHYVDSKELADLARLIGQLDKLIVDPRRARISAGATP